MRKLLFMLAAGFVAMTSPAAFPEPPPATRPSVPRLSPADAPASYDELISRAVAARDERRKAVEAMRQKLKEMSIAGGDPAATDAAKKELLIHRRVTDLEAERSQRAIDLYWFERSLPASQRQEYSQLSPEDREALLETRTLAQRLAVPLPPASFSATPIETVFQFIELEMKVRIVVDWPTLKETGLQPRSPVSIEIGRFNRPAADVLANVVGLLSANKAVLELRGTNDVLISTPAGQARFAEMQKKLAARLRTVRAWEPYDLLLEPIDLTQVPLSVALSIPRTVGDPPLFVDWPALARAGITAETPVDLRLGVHTLGQRLAVLAEAMDTRAAVQKQGRIRFDVHPCGEIILSTGESFDHIAANVDRVLAAARAEETRNLLRTRIPEAILDRATLQEAFEFLADVTKLDYRVDWNSLQPAGLTPRNAVSMHLYNAPLAFVLAMITDTPARVSGVQWEVEEGRILIHGPAGR